MKIDYISEADMTAAFVPLPLRNTTRDAKSILESKHKVKIGYCFERLTIEFHWQKDKRCMFKRAFLYTWKLLLDLKTIGKHIFRQQSVFLWLSIPDKRTRTTLMRWLFHWSLQSRTSRNTFIRKYHSILDFYFVLRNIWLLPSRITNKDTPWCNTSCSVQSSRVSAGC